MSQPTAPIRSCPALLPSVCGLGYMGNVSRVDNMAAHVCTGAARRCVGAELPFCEFVFSLSAFLFARRRLSSDKVTFKPDT